MPTFNIEKIEFKTKCGIKEEKIRNIIEDSFPVADEINFGDVAKKIGDGLKNLGYNFNVHVAQYICTCFQINCGISIVYKELIKYIVKYDGVYNFKCDDRTTTGNKYYVFIWN